MLSLELVSSCHLQLVSQARPLNSLSVSPTFLQGRQATCLRSRGWASTRSEQRGLPSPAFFLRLLHYSLYFSSPFSPLQ